MTSDKRTFDCGLCGYHRSLETRVRYYDLPQRLPVLAWPCWCWGCDAVSLAEHVPGLAAILEHARAWKRRDMKFMYTLPYLPIGVGTYDEERDAYAIAYFDALFEWRKARKSPARCLYCGSRWIGLAREERGKFEHPGCGGMIQTFHRWTTWCGMSMAEVYSAEGLKLYEELVRA